MNLPLTYGQCLRRIMQRNGLSIHTLAKKLGQRSGTQLSRILSDEVSPALLTKFHHQFMLIFDWLISPADIRELSASLQYSCLGPETYITRRAMHAMLFEPSPERAASLPLVIYPHAKPAHHTLSDLLHMARAHAHIELLILGSAYDALLPLFAGLLKAPNNANDLRIRHYFVMEENAAKLVSQVSALVPFLSTPTYEGAYCTEVSPEACRFLRQNPVAIARSITQDGECVVTLFTPPQKDGISVCRMTGSDTLFTFYTSMLDAHKDQMRPVKSVYPKPTTVGSLMTICQRDLFLEQGRATCFVRLDLCFHALPEEIVLAALQGGAAIGLEPDDPRMLELRRIHRSRYQNLFGAKHPTMLLMSAPAMRDFMRTGHLSDHLFAMRDFTPEERSAILSGFLDAVRSNPNLHVHLFDDDTLTPAGCFACYEEMGVQISDNNTAYNLADNHSEVFVGLPAFADSLRAYCENTLIPEFCLDEAASIACLASMLDAPMEDA